MRFENPGAVGHGASRGGPIREQKSTFRERRSIRIFLVTFLALLGGLPAPAQSGAAPGFTAQPSPSNLLFVAGTTNHLSFSASFAKAVSYQWYSGAYSAGHNTAIGTGVTNEILGATTATLSFTPRLPAAEITNYFLVVQDSGGNLQTSSPVSLHLLSADGVFDRAVLILHPLAYYPLNETSGKTVYNYSPVLGSALNGVIQTGIRQAPNCQGLPGPTANGFGAANFAIGMGSSNGVKYVQTANNTGGPSGTGILITNTALDYLGSVSVAVWVQLPKGFNNGGNQEYVYGQAGDNALLDFGNSGGSAPVMYFSVGGASFTGGPVLNDGKWHFWTATFDARTMVGVCYLDGATNFTAIYHAETATRAATDIGSSTADTRNLSGNVCRLAVFTNMVLTAQEVSNLYTAAGLPTLVAIKQPTGSVAQPGAVAPDATPIIYWRQGPACPDFSLEIGGTLYIASVNFLTKQEQMVLCLIFVLLLTGWAVKTWRIAHPAAVVVPLVQKT